MSSVAVSDSSAPAARLRIFEAEGLSKTYDGGRIQALQGVDLIIHEGEFVAILGPSGCGKSTLLNLIGTLEKPCAGMFLYRGRAVNDSFDGQAYRAHDLGFVFQAFHLLPTFSVIENVQMPMFETNWTAKERYQRANELLRSVGLTERLNGFPTQLSGGERQRVAVARSLANRPSVLLADEPTGNLDSISAADVMSLIIRIHREQRITILLVTHDPAVASRASREIRMKDGKIISDSGGMIGLARPHFSEEDPQ
ncbi:MAG: ABC transporter ATP-binding protein [Verrucomicrobiota bacterium]